MKIIITERQYGNLFLEQKPDSMMPGQIEKFGYKQSDSRTLEPSLKKQEEYLKSLDGHVGLLIAEIAVGFVPVVGPLLSAGIGLADAAMYYKEGNTKMAGLSAMFSLLPGAVQLVFKIPGIKTLGSKGLNMLAKKIGTGQKLTQTELSVANGLAANKDLVKSNLNLLTKQLAEKHVARKKIGKEVVNLGGTIGGYHGSGKAYDYLYDKNVGDNSIPKTLNLNAKVSDVNREAAKNIKWD